MNAAENIPNTRPGHTEHEVGIHTASQHERERPQRLAPADVPNFLQANVPDQAQGVVQESEDKNPDKGNLGPKPTPVEQV